MKHAAFCDLNSQAAQISIMNGCKVDFIQDIKMMINPQIKSTQNFVKIIFKS